MQEQVKARTKLNKTAYLKKANCNRHHLQSHVQRLPLSAVEAVVVAAAVVAVAASAATPAVAFEPFLFVPVDEQNIHIYTHIQITNKLPLLNNANIYVCSI